jgi:hypothetical protein
MIAKTNHQDAEASKEEEPHGDHDEESVVST